MAGRGGGGERELQRRGDGASVAGRGSSNAGDGEETRCLRGRLHARSREEQAPCAGARGGGGGGVGSRWQRAGGRSNARLTFLLVQHHGLAETRARRSLLGGQRESVRIRDLSRLPKTGETATTDLSALRACTMIAHLPRLLAQKLHEAAVKSRQTARLSFPFQFMWFSPL